MNTTLTEALKEAYTLAPATRVVFHTLEIRQTGVQAPIFLVRSRKVLVATDETATVRTFLPCGFQFSLPASNEEGARGLNISIDNIDRRVTTFVEIAKGSTEPVKVIYRPFVSEDLSQPQMSPPLVLYLKDVQITSTQVNGRATFMDVVNKKFPAELYTRDRFAFLG